MIIVAIYSLSVVDMHTNPNKRESVLLLITKPLSNPQEHNLRKYWEIRMFSVFSNMFFPVITMAITNLCFEEVFLTKPSN